MQIGDVVYYETEWGEELARVTSVGEYGLQVATFSTVYDEADVSKVFPVKVTEDVLRDYFSYVEIEWDKGDLVRCGGKVYTEFKIATNIYIRDFYTHWRINNHEYMRIEYVHELQHYLRAFKIDKDMAVKAGGLKNRI